MKKILIGIMFLLVTTFAMAGTINSVRLSGNTLSINFDNKDNIKPKVEYDKINRLLYLEFPACSLGDRVRLYNVEGRYIDSIDTVDQGGSVGVFITLAKDVTYSGSMNGKRYNVIMNKSGQKQYTIVVDAGHGGKDPGAKGSGYQEKNMALAVAKYLAADLSKDFNVIMTRRDDTFIPLSERPKMGNRQRADFFISVHINASRNGGASGSEVYYFSTEKPSAYAAKIAAFENSSAALGGEKDNQIKQIMGSLAYKKNQEMSVNFAQPTVAALAGTLDLKNNGIHGANFAVLRGFDGPGVLLELGYISNKSDLSRLINNNNQQAVARAVASQVRAYFK